MTELEKATMYKMLKEVKSLASHASLTGALDKGAPILAATYNKCLAALKSKGDQTAEQLFPELPANANIDEIGVAAALLASYLRPPRRPGGLHPHDIAAYAEDHLREDYDEDYDEE
ncbi:MAG: hypothetical protein ACOX21_04770 [Bacillota bacterium]|nr:hypothetical protein [Bacillota bacterium]HOC06266.1 hypothetical protein [Bacillota bacterium]HPZ21988.1 hypothetical protein [Bacillota bacterium]HQD19796.1 hypothetical protein [Bacillota bacterium]